MSSEKASAKNTWLAAALAVTVAVSVAAAVLFAPAPAHAEGFGTVDFSRLINQSPQGKAQSRELEEEFAERQRALKGRFDLYRSRQEDFEKNRLLLGEEEAENQSEDLRELERQLRRAQREFDEDFARRRNQRLRKLEALIAEAVTAVAALEKLELVFQRQQVVYADASIDLTEKVLEELTARAEQ